MKIYLIARYTLLAKIICETSFREHNGFCDRSEWSALALARTHAHACTNTITRVYEHNHRHTNTPTNTILDVVIIVKYFVSDNRLAASRHHGLKPKERGRLRTWGEVSKSVCGRYFCDTAHCRGSSQHNVLFSTNAGSRK